MRNTGMICQMRGEAGEEGIFKVGLAKSVVSMKFRAICPARMAGPERARPASRLLKNSAEPPLRPESANRKAARKGVSSERPSPSELTPRKHFLAQPEGQ